MVSRSAFERGAEVPDCLDVEVEEGGFERREGSLLGGEILTSSNRALSAKSSAKSPSGSGSAEGHPCAGLVTADVFAHTLETHHESRYVIHFGCSPRFRV